MSDDENDNRPVLEIPDFKKHGTYYDDAKVLVVGPSGSGKSMMVKNLVRDYGPGKVRVFCPSAAAINLYPKFIPKICISRKWKRKEIKALIAKQKKLSNAKKLGLPGAEQDIRMMVIIDDWAGTRSVMHDPLLINWFLKGRHDEFQIVLLVQNYMLASDKVRKEADLLVHLPQPSTKAIKTIFNEQNGAFPDVDIMIEFHKQATKNHGALIIDFRKGVNESEHFNAYQYKPAHADTFDFKAGNLLYQTWGAMVDKVLEEAGLDEDSSGDEVVDDSDDPRVKKKGGKKKA